MTGPQQQALFDCEARRAALVDRVRRPAAVLSGPVCLLVALAVICAALLPALCMAITGTPA